MRSTLGLHLVRTDSREGDRVKASQILLRLAPSAEDSLEAKKLVREIYRRLEAGESFETLARKYSDDHVSAEHGGRLGTFQLDGLTELYRQRLAGLKPGDIADPIESPQGYQILRLAGREEARAPTFEDRP